MYDPGFKCGVVNVTPKEVLGSTQRSYLTIYTYMTVIK